MSENKPGPFAWVWDEQALGQLKEAIYSAQEVVWDTETTGLASHAVEGGTLNNGIGARQALATFTLPQADAQGLWDGIEPTTWIVPLSHPDSPFLGRWRKISAELMELVLKLKKPLTGHNLKYSHCTTDPGTYAEAGTGNMALTCGNIARTVGSVLFPLFFYFPRARRARGNRNKRNEK